MSTITETNWVVITGAPASGKTSIFHELTARNLLTRPEPGTIYIESQLAQGKTLPQICADQAQLQRAIVDTAARMEHEIDPGMRFYLDRSAADTLAYCRLYDFDDTYFREQSTRFRYRQIFMLDRLPFKPNHVRIENDSTAALIDTYLEDAYRSLGYDVTRVPVMSIEKRVAFLLEHTA